MIDNPKSGLLVRSPPWFPAEFISTRWEVVWPNGSKALCFSSEEPDSIRGNEFHLAWCDEKCAWIYIDQTWDNLMMCMRLSGLHIPQTLVTTTPRPQKTLREMLADPHTHVVRGTTFDNADNLPPTFFRELLRKYEGTRLGRQELYAEILDDLKGALWHMDRTRLESGHPDLSKPPGINDLRCNPRNAEELADLRRRLVRVVIGVDPAITTNPWSDITGIVIVGLAEEGHLYVLEDRSLRGKPNEWAEAIFAGIDKWSAHCIVLETNRGGELVESTLRNFALLQKRQLPRILGLNSQEGKVGRAEPVSALYEQGLVHHVGHLAELEDEMTNWEPFMTQEDIEANKKPQKSPNRVDALVFACAELRPNMADYQGLSAMAPPPPPSPTVKQKLSERAGPSRRMSSRWRRN